MSNIYLYVKTHNKTGLKYLGKTTKLDPHLYQGSGTRWTNHINKHGYDVTTKIIKECHSKEELKEWGLYYSNLWYVVESSEWANLQKETGEGSDGSQRWWNNNNIQIYREFPPDNTYKLGRLNFINRGGLAGAEVQRGKVWVNNGLDEFMTYPPIPEGYQPGRRPALKKNDGSSSLGTYHWTNGVENKMSKICPGDDWKRGRTLKISNSPTNTGRFSWTDGINNKMSKKSPGINWKRGRTSKSQKKH